MFAHTHTIHKYFAYVTINVKRYNLETDNRKPTPIKLKKGGGLNFNQEKNSNNNEATTAAAATEKVEQK